MRERATLWHLDAIHRYGKHTASLHRVRGIRAEIHEHLMDLRGISDHRGVAGR